MKHKLLLLDGKKLLYIAEKKSAKTLPFLHQETSADTYRAINGHRTENEEKHETEIAW